MSEEYWIGRTIGGRYEIRTLLGRGGMSAVYGGYDPNLSRNVAIKLIHNHLSDNPEFVRRFQEEASAVAKFRHPHIVQVYDFNNDDKTYYIIFELVNGMTLQQVLQILHDRNEYLPQARAAEIAAQVADALEYAHKRGVIHRDIKPGNVMINQDDNVILTDFGLAKIVGGTQHTAAGAVLGTMRYISPEQIKSSPVDGRSDIYSLGVMLYEMAGNQPPFNADSAMALMMKHLNDPIPPLYDLRPDIAPDLVDVIDKAMAKEADDRFQTAGEMAVALRSISFAPGMASVATAATMILSQPPVEAASSLEQTYVQPVPEKEISTDKAGAVAATSVSAESTPKPTQSAPPKKRSRRGLAIGALLLLAIVAIGALFMSGVIGGSADEPEPIAVTEPEQEEIAVAVATETPTAEPTPTDEPVVVADELEPTATDEPDPTPTPEPTATTPVEPTVDLMEDAIEFTDDDYGFSMRVPSDWQVADNVDEGIFAFASAVDLLDADTTYDDGMYLEAFTTPNTDNIEPDELADWLKDAINDTFDQETFNTRIITEPALVELDELDAAQARFSADFNRDGTDDDVIMTTLLKDDQLVILYAITSAENHEQWTDIHTAIVESVQLEGSVPIVATDDETESPSTTASGPVVASGGGLPLDFEGSGSWAVGTQKNGTLTLTSANPYSGSSSGEIAYEFESDASDFVIFLQENAVSGTSNALCLQVFGTGDSSERHYLNAWIRDADGQSWQIPFGQVSHSGWREMVANFDGERNWPFRAVDESIKDTDAEITYPITFRGLALDDAPDAFNGTGTIYVDDLRSCSATATNNSTPQASTTATATTPITGTVTPAPSPTPLSLSVSSRTIQNDPDEPELYTITVFLSATGGSGDYTYYYDNLASTATTEPQLSFVARCGNDAPHSIQVEDASGARVSINYTVSRGDLPCG